MVEFLYISIGIAVIFVIYLLFDKFYLKRQRLLKGNVIRILLFESVGKDKTFKGTFEGLEKNDDILGVYIFVKKVKKPISNVSPTDFFYDQKFGRALIVCKFSDDDYRVMSSLKNELWFKLIEKQGKKGELITDYEEYIEPLGITSDGRTASRFNRSFGRRMAQLRQEKASFLEKYGSYIMMGTMMIIVLMSTGYNANKFEEASHNMAAVFDEKAKALLDEIAKPSFMTGILQSIERDKLQSEAPLT